MYIIYDDDPDTLHRVRAEVLAGVRVGRRVRVRAGGRVGGGCRSGSAQQHATDEFAMRRNTIAKPSYHWNSLIIRNCHRRRILYKHNQHTVTLM